MNVATMAGIEVEPEVRCPPAPGVYTKDKHEPEAYYSLALY